MTRLGVLSSERRLVQQKHSEAATAPARGQRRLSTEQVHFPDLVLAPSQRGGHYYHSHFTGAALEGRGCTACFKLASRFER